MTTPTPEAQALLSRSKWQQEAYALQRAAWRVVILRAYDPKRYNEEPSA